MSKTNKKARRPIKTTRRPVTRRQLVATHIFGSPLPTDTYYVGVANKLLATLRRAYPGDSSEAQLHDIALSLTAWLEDLVSGLGIWEVFVDLHEELYGKPLPFFDLDATDIEYLRIAPTPAAVQFLLWHYVGTQADPTSLINPSNIALEQIAHSLFHILIEAFGQAPDTPSRPSLAPLADDPCALLLNIRDYCRWIALDCYLTRLHNPDHIISRFDTFFAQLMDASYGSTPEDLKSYARYAFIPMNVTCGPLDLPSYRWLIKMFNISHTPDEAPLLPLIDTLSARPYDYYRLSSLSPQAAELETLQGDTITLSPLMMPGGTWPDHFTPGTSAFCSLIYFNGAWQLNGQALLGMPPAIFTDMKQQVDTLAQSETAAYQALLTRLHGQRLAAFRDTHEMLQAITHPDDPQAPAISQSLKDAKDILLFLQTDGNLSILPDYAPLADFPGNPLYSEDQSRERGISLLLSPDTPEELRHYAAEHNLAPGAMLRTLDPEPVRLHLLQDNIPFLQAYTHRDRLTLIPPTFHS